MSESLLQIAFTNWIRAACPEVIHFHVFNEASTTVVRNKIGKDRGVLPGVHDNCLILSDGSFATIELKSPELPKSQNKYSPSQKLFAERMDKAGCKHACCQNGEEILAAVKSLGLNPQIRFPAVLQNSKRVMFMQELFDAGKPA